MLLGRLRAHKGHAEDRWASVGHPPSSSPPGEDSPLTLKIWMPLAEPPGSPGAAGLVSPEAKSRRPPCLWRGRHGQCDIMLPPPKQKVRGAQVGGPSKDCQISHHGLAAGARMGRGLLYALPHLILCFPGQGLEGPLALATTQGFLKTTQESQPVAKIAADFAPSGLIPDGSGDLGRRSWESLLEGRQEEGRKGWGGGSVFWLGLAFPPLGCSGAAGEAWGPSNALQGSRTENVGFFSAAPHFLMGGGGLRDDFKALLSLSCLLVSSHSKIDISRTDGK